MKIYKFPQRFQQDQDGIYIGFISALPGCHSFGATKEEAEQNLQEVFAGFIPALRKQKRELPTKGILQTLPHITITESVTPEQMICVIKPLGFVLIHQNDNHSYYGDKDNRLITVPRNAAYLPRGIMQMILYDLHVSEEEFQNSGNGSSVHNI